MNIYFHIHANSLLKIIQQFDANYALFYEAEKLLLNNSGMNFHLFPREHKTVENSMLAFEEFTRFRQMTLQL
jgi:hypothetical protein